jgi:hypothetical protein
MCLDYLKFIEDSIAELNVKVIVFPSEVMERWKDYEG